MALEVLGIKHNKVELSEEDKDIYTKWDEAKKAKDFANADKYRDILKDRGIL